MVISLLHLLSLSFVSSDYRDTFTKSNRDILSKWRLMNKTLVMDKVEKENEEITWRQASKCGLFECSESYMLVDYYEDGDKNLPLLKVFVAKKHGDPPLSFSTQGYSRGQHELHFGNVPIEESDGASALFFVIHPNSWRPYQDRFLTSSFTAFVKDILSQAQGAWAAGIETGIEAAGIDAAEIEAGIEAAEMEAAAVEAGIETLLDAAGIEVAGIQAAGIEAPGIEADGIEAVIEAGIMAAEIEATEIEADGVEAVIEAGIQAAGIDAAGIEAAIEAGIDATGIGAPGIEAVIEAGIEVAGIEAAGIEAGAVIGSVIPGAGTVVGGLLGGIIGNAAGTVIEDFIGEYLCYIGNGR